MSNLPPISPDDIARAKAVPIMSVAEGYGLKLRSDRGVPCPACGGVDGFSVNTNKRVFNCRRGGVGGDVIELVRHVDGVDFRGAIERLLGGKIEAKQRQPEAKADGNEQAALAKALKSAARVVSGIVPVGRTPGEAYLRDVRKIDADAIRDVLSRTDAIGWHPAVYLSEPEWPKVGDPPHPLHGQRLGAIIGIMTDALTGRPTGAISRTYIGPDGRKVLKAKTFGAPRGIIRLSRADEVKTRLFIAEGLETTLAAMSRKHRPIWACGDAGVMKTFPPLSRIESLTIIADHDPDDKGEKAARAVEARWAGRDVRIYLRNALGDFNDALMDRTYER